MMKYRRFISNSIVERDITYFRIGLLNSIKIAYNRQYNAIRKNENVKYEC